MILREMWGTDLTPTFRKTINALAKVTMSDELMRQVFRQNLHHFRSYVAEENGEIVGVCRLMLDRKYSHDGKYAGTIEDVAIRPDMQGKGIGKALVQYTINQAKALDCYKVILNCTPELTRFYKSCGFVVRDVGMRLDL